MLLWDALTSLTWTLSEDVLWLGNQAIKTPLIGNWCSERFFAVSQRLADAWIDMVYIGRWLDTVDLKLAQMLSWSSIKSNILSSWGWLNTIDDKIYARASAVWPWLNLGSQAILDWVSARWSWLNTIDDRIRNTVLSSWRWLNTIDDRIRSTALASWSWLNTIDDRIRSTVLSRWSWLNTIDDKIVARARQEWSWLNTIDDKIRDVAWNHVASKLGGWMLDWLMLNLTLWGRIGYRVLDKIWNMEWDDAKKEVK